MTTERWARIEIDFSYMPEDVPRSDLETLFNSIADLLFDWATDYPVDPLMSGVLADDNPSELKDEEE